MINRAPLGLVCFLASALGWILLCAVGHPPAVTAEEALSTPEPTQEAHGASSDVLDPRTALPLTAMMAEHQKRNMRDHLTAVQEIVAALAAEDMTAAERAARRMGYSDTMAQMCQHMGAAAPGFGDSAFTFHRTADTVAEAARHGDRKAVTAALAATLSTCVGCHATYRQEVVDEATWQRLASEPERP
jgi:Cytochrome C'